MNIEVNSEESIGTTPAQFDLEHQLPLQRAETPPESVIAPLSQIGQLEYEDNPLDYNVKAELIAQIGSLASDSAEVFSDIEATLVGLQHGLALQLGKNENKDKKEYLEDHIADVGSVREAMTDMSFDPDVVRGIWVDLINVPTPEENETTDELEPAKAQDEVSTQDTFIPTPEDIVAIAEVPLREWIDGAKQMMDDIEVEFKDLVYHGGEMDGLSPAEIALIMGRLNVTKHISKLPTNLRGPLGLG